MMLSPLPRPKSWLGRNAQPRAISSTYELYKYLLGKHNSPSDAGVEVTADSAMRLSTVGTCVRVASEDVAGLPKGLYERTGENGEGRRQIHDHWLTALFEQPNAWQTGFAFREMQQAQVELEGNFYALMTVVRGEVRELLPIAPHRVTPKLTPSFKMAYEVQWPDGTASTVPQERMYHVRGLSLDGGVTGMSTISYHMNTIGLGIAMVKYGSGLFKNGAMVRGVLERPKEAPALNETAEKRFVESFDEVYSGVSNAQKTMMLQEGMKYSVLSMHADEAQFIESRKLSRSEIAGIYRIPAHLVNDMEKSNFNNMEQAGIAYVQGGILPRVLRVEAYDKSQLIPAADRGRMYVKYSVDGLLRGDFATRVQGINAAVTVGCWMTRNEARRLQDMPPGPKELDTFLVPNANAKPMDAPKPESNGNGNGQNRLSAILDVLHTNGNGGHR